jgi:hypothetical protein
MTRQEIILSEELVGPRVLVDGHVHDRFRRGRLQLADLPAGPHTLAVGADGCEGKVLVIVLHEGESRRVEVFLKPRARIVPAGGG